MLRKLLGVALIATLFVACKGKTAVDFNDKLVMVQSNLNLYVNNEEMKASKYFEEGKFDSIYALGSRLETFVQSKIDEVEKVKTPDLPQAENFKSAYLKAYKVLKEIYTMYKAIGIAKTDEERQTLVEKVQVLVDEKDEASKDMLAAQRIFATTNDIKLK